MKLILRTIPDRVFYSSIEEGEGFIISPGKNCTEIYDIFEDCLYIKNDDSKELIYANYYIDKLDLDEIIVLFHLGLISKNVLLTFHKEYIEENS